MDEELLSNISGSIQAVESDEDFRPISSFWHSKYVYIAVGTSDPQNEGEGLFLQVEVIAPDEVLGDVELEQGTTRLRDIDEEMASLDSDIVEAIEEATGTGPETPLTYLGEPLTMPGVESVLFQATIREDG